MKKIILILLSVVMIASLSSCSPKEQSSTENDEKDYIIEQNYDLKVKEGEIKGTLALPKEKDFDTVAIIIAGSGPTDRDGNSTISGDNNSLKMLAHSLGGEGIASLRYDKRAAAESQSLIETEEDLIFEDYIEDVNLWIDKLKEDDRFKKIVVIGHSEGALVGAESSSEKDVDGYVSIAGVGYNAADTLERQIQSQSDEVYEQSFPIIEGLRQGKVTSNPPKELESLFRPSVQPYLISWFKYDPFEVIGEVKVPVLILQGDNDLQVTVDDAKRLKEGKPEGKLVIIDNMNHILKDAPRDDKGNLKTYKDPNLPLNETLVTEITSFIKEL